MKKKKIQNYVVNLEECLGQGSFGKVYKGINETDKSPIAVKVLSKKLIDEDESVKETYVEEIKIMRKLHSENIVRFIDVVETENNFYIVQEYCNGGDLRTKLNKEKQFSEAVATEYLTQLLNGFIELMTNGVIHRDMKPENILINNKKAKIADFGFAKNVLSRSQLLRTLVGTPLYMSLQMLKNDKYTSKCDIWALGLLYYQMLYGRVPWNGKSEFELIDIITKVPLKFPKQPEISHNAKDFIQGCLKLEEADRAGWNQVYNHPLFQGTFKEFISKHDRLERKAKQVINQMRVAIHSQNLDLQTVFANMKLTSNSHLKKEQFYEVVKNLYKDVGKEQYQFLFDKFDTNRAGVIEFAMFKKYLSENGVRFKSNRHKKEPLEQSKTQSQERLKKQDKINTIIFKIKSKIDMHKLNLQTVFSSYTKNKENDLSFDMFSKLLLKIDNTLSETDIKGCFSAFDHNGDNKITFAEFSKTLNNPSKK